MMSRLKIGSLFSGIGGIDLGFEQAGFKTAWANDIDAAACKTYRHNFPSTHLIEGDVRDIDPRTLSDIDVLIAGFPCQPFSIMGYRRGFKDPRGNLFFEISRFVDIKSPRVVFLENVQNLMEHDNGKTFLVIYNTLAQFGYSVKYKVINATDVNIPQNRARIFVVAFLDIEDCDRFAFPETVPLEATIDDIIDRNIKHDDIYYYGSNSRYFKELDAKIVDKTGIYRIDDSGVATRKWDICPTLKANMGTYPDRPDYVTRGFQRVLKAHGIPKMRFHDIRHTTASILYDKGWDLKDSQSWLRHSSVQMTGDVYTHISEARKVKMATQLNSTFNIGGTDERPEEN